MIAAVQVLRNHLWRGRVQRGGVKSKYCSITNFEEGDRVVIVSFGFTDQHLKTVFGATGKTIS